MRRIPIAGASLIALLTTCALAQTATNAQSATASNDTSYVTCADKPPGSRTVRSDVLVSSDGKHRAYAEVEAKNFRGQGAAGAPPCVNNSRLFASTETGEYKVVFLQEATDAESGNSLRLVDWSADGRRLLVELSQWAYEGVGVARSPLLYDASYGLFRQPELLHVFNKQFGMECSLEVHVAGFSSDGKVVIETQPLTPEEEEVLGLQTCSKKKAAWALNITNESLTPFADVSKLAHNAKTESQPSK